VAVADRLTISTARTLGAFIGRHLPLGERMLRA
jgi:hypothetical protein